MPTTLLRRRLLATSSTKSAYALTAGMYTMATLAAALSVTEDVAREMIVALGSPTQRSDRIRGIEISAVGSGADDATMSFRVWQVKRGTKAGCAIAGDLELALLYSVACTLSTAVGATAGELIAATERVADTMVETRATAATTPKGMADLVETAYGAVAGDCYSPADNTPARFLLPDVGGGDVLLEPIVGTATGANLLVEGQT